MSDLAFSTASQLAGRVRAGELSALQIVETQLARIESLNPRINAVVYVDAEGAREAACRIDRRIAAGENVGPLAGVPVTVKDMYEVAAMPSTSGTLGRRSFVPDRDATVVERLRGAGAVVLGKTNVPELGLALETTNLVHGTTSNPFALDRTPGGSSGGAAAALAAGLSALEIGSDGGGSIHIPAHFCGVAGFKPTHNRVSKAGHFPVHSGVGSQLAGYGPMARSVADLALAFAVIQGANPRDPDAIPRLDEPEVAVRGLRVAFHTDNGIRAATAETIAAVERVADILERAGASVTEARLPDLDAAFELHMAMLVVDRALLPLWIQAAGTEELHPWVVAGKAYLDEMGADFDSESASLLHDDWHLYRIAAARFMEDHDVLLGPVAPFPAPHHEKCAEAASFDMSSYASLHNVTGYPALAVRAGMSPEGLPIGVQLAARRHRDRLVLDVGALVERACGGFIAPEGFR